MRSCQDFGWGYWRVFILVGYLIVMEGGLIRKYLCIYLCILQYIMYMAVFIVSNYTCTYKVLLYPSIVADLPEANLL